MPDNQTDQLAAALAAFQSGVADPEKTRTATVQPKDQSKPPFSYGYADLATILEAVRPLLGRHKLAVVQDLESDERAVGVRTHIIHESGQQLVCGPFRLPCGGEPKLWGAAATYARRFALLAALGIAVAGDDNEAAAARGATRGRPQQATSRQLAKISAECERGGVGDAEIAEVLKRRYGVETASELTVQQASDLIDRLIAVADERRQAAPAGVDPETGEVRRAAPPEDEEEPPGYASFAERAAAAQDETDEGKETLL